MFLLVISCNSFFFFLSSVFFTNDDLQFEAKKNKKIIFQKQIGSNDTKGKYQFDQNTFSMIMIFNKIVFM